MYSECPQAVALVWAPQMGVRWVGDRVLKEKNIITLSFVKMSYHLLQACQIPLVANAVIVNANLGK